MNTKELKGINRYYVRTQQNEYGNTYYLEPRETCPIDVLNDQERFIVVTFDKDDDYIVVNNKRYYLNRYNSIKATANVDQRLAIVDLNELQKSKSYDFSSKFKRSYTAMFKNFDELRNLAKIQYQSNGCPFFKQVAVYNKDTNKCKYVYEPSFDL
ncbi:hypothetical protein [Limosilactobacillus antri]|uniref:hypothetical protein n=1 Tax=Limosilactobacillus antri TaxID=227943 RepID=UPI001F5AC374|nr:hypothetical protein [Limosilactobacillus antri]